MEKSTQGSQEFNDFLSSFPKAEIINLNPEQQQLYFDLVTKNFIPEIVKLSTDVAHKGEELPYYGEKNRYGVDVKVGTPKKWGDSDYLSVSIDRFIQPKPLELNGELIGNITCQISVSDGQRNIRFVVLDDECLAFINDDQPEGKPLVIRTKEDLFGTEVKSHPLFSVGTPAGWTNKILRRNIIPEFSNKLSKLQPKR